MSLCITYLLSFWGGFVYNSLYINYSKNKRIITIKLPLVIFNQFNTCLVIYYLESYLALPNHTIWWFCISFLKYIGVSIVTILLSNINDTLIEELLNKEIKYIDNIYNKEYIYEFNNICLHPFQYMVTNIVPIVISVFLFRVDIYLLHICIIIFNLLNMNIPYI